MTDLDVFTYDELRRDPHLQVFSGPQLKRLLQHNHKASDIDETPSDSEIPSSDSSPNYSPLTNAPTTETLVNESTALCEKQQHSLSSLSIDDNQIERTQVSRWSFYAGFLAAITSGVVFATAAAAWGSYREQQAMPVKYPNSQTEGTKKE